MFGFRGGWVGQWVESCEITKNLIKLDLSEIILFCLKIYDLDGCMGRWMGGSVGRLMSNYYKSSKSSSN